VGSEKELRLIEHECNGPTHPLPRGGTDLMGPILVLRSSTQTASVSARREAALVDTPLVVVIMTFCAIVAEISYLASSGANAD
jgi:hypothetical protein